MGFGTWGLPAPRRRGERRGFTLIELMIGVVIVGTLSTLAVAGVMAWVRKSRSVERIDQLHAISERAVTAFATARLSTNLIARGDIPRLIHGFCPTAAKVPAKAPKGFAYQTSLTEWTGDLGWSCLRFSIDGTQRYAYGYTQQSPTAFLASAYGDLDGNEIESRLTIDGIGDAATGRVSLGTPTEVGAERE